MAHHRITAESVSIVDVLVTRRPREDCLPQQTSESMAAILSSAVVVQQSGSQIG
jgi:hypothetical protein